MINWSRKKLVSGVTATRVCCALYQYAYSHFCDNSNGDFEFQFSPFKVKLVYGQQRAIVEMDSFIRKLQRNPRSSSNFVSRLLFSWTIPLFKRTYYKVLQVSDVTEPLTQDRSNLLGDRLERYEKKKTVVKSLRNETKAIKLFQFLIVYRKWHEECKKNVKPSLVRAIILTFPFECIMMGILCFINDVVLRLILPFYLEHLLLYFRYTTCFIHKISV